MTDRILNLTLDFLEFIPSFTRALQLARIFAWAEEREDYRTMMSVVEGLR